MISIRHYRKRDRYNGFNEMDSPTVLTPAERKAASLLVVGDGLDGLVKQLHQLQFSKTRHSLSHSSALRRLTDEEYSHVIYSTKSMDTCPSLFTQRACRLAHKPILIAASYEAEPAIALKMLLDGARSFLALPLKSEMLDIVIGEATNGPPIQPAILLSPQRNEKLVRSLIDSLDELAWSSQASKRLGLEARTAEPSLDALRLSASTLKIFCNGGSAGFVTTLLQISETLTPRGNTRISRLRRQLQNQRRK